jgi:serine/threonine protein kinase
MAEALAQAAPLPSLPPLPPLPPPALPRRLGRRVLLKLAARGGMGEVYLAATTGIEGAERPCIVKTVRRDHVHDSSFLARFLDEARVQAQLQHPGVAQVLEAANEEDGPYTVVEYVEGRSLCDVRQRAIQTGVPIGWANAVAIAIEVAQALAHVHERSGPDGSPLGIVHRDLSPQNVMVGYAGEVKLIDFGTARGHNRRCHTVAGVVFAKPGYVAPEVARQQVGDGRIDLYALGIILWELCAGRRFLTTDPQGHLDQVASGRTIIPAVAQACGAPRELDEVIANLTRNDPDERYARAAVAVADLGRLLARAPTAEAGERGVRARTAVLMRALWPHEPARARAEFMRLVQEARPFFESEPASGERPRERSPAAPSGVHAIASTHTAAGAVDASQLPGTPYRLVRSIGEGSSGVVWEAEHTELQRRIALKMLSAELASSRSSLELFRREARIMAAVPHSNLVQILDFGKSLDGRVFLAMELLTGETLGARLRRGPLMVEDATRIAIKACAALEATHVAGLVHRDVKPQNLMVTTTGIVKLLDFGIATPPLAGSSRSVASMKERSLRGFAMFGTPEYMAPEQVAGEAIDPRTDIYALGCVLYEMLTGVPPFDGPTFAVMGRQLRAAPRPLHARMLGGPVSSGLKEVVTRAMAKDPKRRFATARAMRSALEETLLSGRRRQVARSVMAATLLAIAGGAVAGISAREAGKLLPLEMDPAAAPAVTAGNGLPGAPAVRAGTQAVISSTPAPPIAPAPALALAPATAPTTATAPATAAATATPPASAGGGRAAAAAQKDAPSPASRRALSLSSRRL